MDNRDLASRAFGILVEHAGAKESLREDFVHHWGTREFRFQGSLGFGGKFYNEPKGFQIDCYKEDETPERLATIQEVNQILKDLE